MKTGDFFKKCLSMRVWGNMAAMAMVVVLLVAGVKFGIDRYTRHGEEIAIPDVRRKTFADAENMLLEKGLKVVISDTGYVRSLPPDCILEQSPEPGKAVKTGRVIYLIINSAHSPMLTLPDIIDNNSYREARAKLIAMGFKVGSPQYVRGEKDWVYGVKCKGRNLSNGDKVSVEDMLVIQVGDGMRDMNDSLIYTDGGFFYEDSLTHREHGGHMEGIYEDDGAGSGEGDDFEVVDGPE